MSENPPVGLALEKLGIPHRVFRHGKPVTSLKQVAQERGQRPGQVVRSILFRTGMDEYLMVLAAGPAQLSWKALRRQLGQSRLTMAAEDEVLAVTGYRIGTVGPFGLLRPLKVLIEKSVMEEEEVSIGSGMRNVAVILKSKDLHRAFGNPEVVALLSE
jgi:Cys-tRNA(Pro)/Cys-tRNA(Cys) deacylase